MPSFDWSQADLLIKGLCEREWALGVDDLVFMVFLPHFSFSSCNWHKECRPIHLSHPLQPLFLSDMNGVTSRPHHWSMIVHQSPEKRREMSPQKKVLLKMTTGSLKNIEFWRRKNRWKSLKLLSNGSILIWAVKICFFFSDCRDQNN